jgi:hypothetical protein
MDVGTMIFKILLAFCLLSIGIVTYYSNTITIIVSLTIILVSLSIQSYLIINQAIKYRTKTNCIYTIENLILLLFLITGLYKSSFLFVYLAVIILVNCIIGSYPRIKR